MLDRSLQSAFAGIRLMVLDVDGVLTDGKLFFLSDALGWMCSFHAHDGYGIKTLIKSGIPVAIITGASKRLAVKARIKELGIRHALYDSIDKMAAFNRLMVNFPEIKPEQVLYMGDDIPDKELMEHVGLGVAPQSAIPEVKSSARYVAIKNGGEGAVREVIDLILAAKKA